MREIEGGGNGGGGGGGGAKEQAEKKKREEGKPEEWGEKRVRKNQSLMQFY